MSDNPHDTDPHDRNANEPERLCLDEEIALKIAHGEGHMAIVCFLEDLLEGFDQKGFSIEQFNLSLQAADCQLDLDIAALERADWRDNIPFFGDDQIALRITALVEAPVILLREIVRESIDVVCWATRAVCTERKTDIFPATSEPDNRTE